MKILILEDEPIIAIDLEDIVASRLDADIVIASTLREAVTEVARGVDFALLDVRLGEGRQTCLPVARMLLEQGVPFCFVSSFAANIPGAFMGVPRIQKPFREDQIGRVLPSAA